MKSQTRTCIMKRNSCIIKFLFKKHYGQTEYSNKSCILKNCKKYILAKLCVDFNLYVHYTVENG